MNYTDFLEAKTQLGGNHGFDPLWMPDFLYPFQQSLVEWATRKGRAAIFADCGLGKTPMQLVWAENVCRKTDGRVLILTPLAVAPQTVREAGKFGIDAQQSRDGVAMRRITVTNYQQLQKFNSQEFAGVVCDESSILKNFDGVFRREITDFMRKLPYRLLCTATAAPNDYVELGTSAEALGVMERKHMLAQFFTHDGGDTSAWRVKGHAREHVFWRWVCSWARACRKPSDLGFSNEGFDLPKLQVNRHQVSTAKPLDGYLLDLPAVGLEEQRSDLRRTINERSAMAAKLVNSHNRPAVCWTNLNQEADTITRLIPGALNVQGSDSDEFKEEAFDAFVTGKLRVIVSKPTIAGFGLNWQHCSDMSVFPSHSYEQYYQLVRRCWRFFQKRPVTVDMITTDGQANVLANMEAKERAASHMFSQLVARMSEELKITKNHHYTKQQENPSWL